MDALDSPRQTRSDLVSNSSIPPLTVLTQRVKIVLFAAANSLQDNAFRDGGTPPTSFCRLEQVLDALVDRKGEEFDIASHGSDSRLPKPNNRAARHVPAAAGAQVPLNLSAGQIRKSFQEQNLRPFVPEKTSKLERSSHVLRRPLSACDPPLDCDNKEARRSAMQARPRKPFLAAPA